MTRRASALVIPALALAVVHTVAAPPPWRLALELQDYASLPITGELDGLNTRGLLARVNFLRDEPGERIRKQRLPRCFARVLPGRMGGSFRGTPLQRDQSTRGRIISGEGFPGPATGERHERGEVGAAIHAWIVAHARAPPQSTVRSFQARPPGLPLGW